MLKLLLDSRVGELRGEVWDFVVPVPNGAGHVVLRAFKQQPQAVAPAERHHRVGEFRPEKVRPPCEPETVLCPLQPTFPSKASG